LPRELAGERGAGQDSCRRVVYPNGERVTEAISEPFYKQIAQEIANSQWIAIPTDQLLGPDTGRVFNDASADIAAGNITPEQAVKTQGARHSGSNRLSATLLSRSSMIFLGLL
jgi:hypothetical protein